MPQLVKILFTTSDKLMSQLICKVTGDPISHCAIQIDEFVIHSSVHGVEILPYRKFASLNKIVFAVQTDYPATESLYKSIAEWHGHKYDVGALVYLGCRYALPFLFPKKNLWGASGMFLCTELVQKLVELPNDDMITPYQLYLRLTGGQHNG